MQRRFTNVAAAAAFAAVAVLAMSPANLSFAQTSPPPNTRPIWRPPVTPHVTGTAVNLPPALKNLKVFHYGTAGKSLVDLPQVRPSLMNPGAALHMIVASDPGSIQTSSEIVLTPNRPYAGSAALTVYDPFGYYTASLGSSSSLQGGEIGWSTGNRGTYLDSYGYASFSVSMLGAAGKTSVIDVAFGIFGQIDPSCHVLVWGPDGLPPTSYPCPTASESDGRQHVRFAYFADQAGQVRFDVGAENYPDRWYFFSATIDTY